MKKIVKGIAAGILIAAILDLLILLGIEIVD